MERLAERLFSWASILDEQTRRLKPEFHLARARPSGR